MQHLDADMLGLAEADREEGDPGQDRRDDQQARGDQLGRTRAGRRLVMVVAVVVMIMAMPCGMAVMMVAMIVVMVAGLAAGMLPRAPTSAISPAMSAPSSGRKTMA